MAESLGEDGQDLLMGGMGGKGGKGKKKKKQSGSFAGLGIYIMYTLALQDTWIVT